MLFITILVFIGLAIGLAWYLVAQDHGEKEPVAALWMAAAFGLLGAVLTLFLEAGLVPDMSTLVGAPIAKILGSALLVGVIEETCKFVPLALVLYGKRYFNEHTDGIIYFALAGLAFGLPENILYTLQYGTGAGSARLVLTPFFHAAITGSVGYFLIRFKLAGKSPWLTVLPLLAAVLLHGFYDFGLLSGVTAYALLSVCITLGVTITLFVLYLRATKRDQQSGLSAVGHNNFCRSCGQPNLQHHLYCTHCGQHA